MLIVLDTNVIVSALLSPLGPPADILRLIVTGNLRLCVDNRILAEYTDVMARPKFDFAPTMVETLLDYLRADSVPVTAIPSGIPLPDPADIPFLDVAITAKAEALVTGNLKHFRVAQVPSLRIESPASFLAGYHGRGKSRGAR